MNLSEIGSRIKSERKRQGISQEKLAEMINVSPHYIYEIERGIKAMSLETLINITRALKMSADYLIFGSLSNMPNAPDSRSLADRLGALDEEQRQRAESAFCALLPYLR
ncbi:MAG: helix-turn-helix domain-containing protein [Oscillospiraceae bacterium]|nr:helix-turn-helix domain-containing protein [Oscillospiraceae bacterium]